MTTDFRERLTRAYVDAQREAWRIAWEIDERDLHTWGPSLRTADAKNRGFRLVEFAGICLGLLYDHCERRGRA